MMECVDRIFEYCAGGESSFRQSRLIQDAVIRNLQTMAESSQRLSEPIKAMAPDVPWRAISGFRNVIDSQLDAANNRAILPAHA